MPNRKIDVLDNGYVRLVSYMQPVPEALTEGWSGDLEAVRNARVSYDGDWRTGEDEGKDEKLLNYLYKNHHTSPLESIVFTFEVSCPLYVARQWMRHRTFSYNEVSARYTQLPDDMYVPAPEKIGTQSTSNKQMRDDVQRNDAEGISEMIRINNENQYQFYELLLSMKVPRELARGSLPLNTYTRFFCTVNLNNLFKFIKLRDHAHAQYEILVYAKALLELIEPICPILVAAYKNELDNPVEK